MQIAANPMSSKPDDPPVPSEVDLRGFSGLMIDVERLFASELVAIGTPEEKWAAFMLWCRAWQQTPPGSLPQDERVLAAFSGSGTRWPKVKKVAMRGFVLCSDGRLYHRVLCEQVMEAWKKRKAYRSDQERLRAWRAKNKENGANGHDETPNETRAETAETRFNGVSETPREPSKKEKGLLVEGEMKEESANADSGAGEMLPSTALQCEEGKTRRRSRPTKDELLIGCAEFFGLYPECKYKGGQNDCETQWLIARRAGISAEDIIDGLKRYPWDNFPDPNFWWSPAKWLKGGRWKDGLKTDGMDPTLRAAGVTQADLDMFMADDEARRNFFGKG